MNHPATQNRNSSVFSLNCLHRRLNQYWALQWPSHGIQQASPANFGDLKDVWSWDPFWNGDPPLERWDEPINFWASDPSAVLQHNDMGDDAFLAGQASEGTLRLQAVQTSRSSTRLKIEMCIYIYVYMYICVCKYDVWKTGTCAYMYACLNVTHYDTIKTP